MEPAQPADRVPTDATPPDGQPPVGPAARPASQAEEPALVESSAGPAPLADAGEPALVEPAAGEPALAEPAAGEPALAEPADRSAAGAADRHPAAGDQPARPARKEKPRSERSPRDMALSLLVLLVPIVLLLAFYRGFLGGDEPTTVDAAPAVDQARAAGAFPVSAPEGLASGWRTVSARYRAEPGGATLRIGYLTPEGRGAQLVESNVPADQLLRTELKGGQPQGPAELPGGSWQRYTARDNEQALVLLEPNRTVLVIGDARESELRELATALR